MLLLTYTRGEEKEIEKARSRMLKLVREKRNHREIQRKEDKGILMRKGQLMASHMITFLCVFGTILSN